MSIAVDPALQLILRAGLSLLFAVAASHKLRNIAVFSSTLEAYRLLPASWSGFAARLCVGIEVCIAFGVWLSPFVAFAAGGLLAVYSIAIAANLARGRRNIDCGCGGPGVRQTLSYALVLRNGLLVGLATICALPSSTRPLEWIDAWTVVAGVTGLSLLYSAADGLLARWRPLSLPPQEAQHA